MITRKRAALLVLADDRRPRVPGRRARAGPPRQPARNHDGDRRRLGDVRSSTGGPSTRGRTIFGSAGPLGRRLVPGRRRSDDAVDEPSAPHRRPLAVPAGEYSLWILPTEDRVDADPQQGRAHVPHELSRDPATSGASRCRSRRCPSPVEQLTFAIEPNTRAPGGRIVMTWATTEVSVPFLVGE